MEIASCCPVLWHLPICCRPHPLSICSSVSLPVSPLRVHCSLSCRGCNDVSSIRISLFRSLRKCGLHFGSFQTKCSSHSTMNGSAVETDDYQQDFLKNVLGSEGATVLEKDHEVFQDDDDAVSKYQIDNKMVKVCDKLIVIFMVDKPTTTDWRRLLAFSKNWENLRPYFFIHCQKRADSESDPEMKQKLLRLHRKLKEIDDDVQRHNELLNLIKGAPDDIISIVTKRRKDFTNEFFVHLHNVAQSYFDNPTEQNAHTKLANDCLAALKAFDTAAESMQAVAAAELKFQDILNSPSLDAACRKIDDLAQKKQLDSTFMLMLTKAWSNAKESNLVRDEAKDMLFHLYNTAIGNLQRLVPKDIRIIKFLLKIESTEEQLAALNDAFTPGVELEGEDVDCLYSTPERLYTMIRTVVDAYHFSKEGTLIREARDLMSPKLVQKLEKLKILIQKHFL